MEMWALYKLPLKCRELYCGRANCLGESKRADLSQVRCREVEGANNLRPDKKALYRGD